MKIAVMGLGIIGSVWAENLRRDGLEVRCWNRTPKDVPGFFATAREAASGAEFIIIVVADPPSVQAVLDQILPALGPGQMVIQSSTVSAHWSREFAGAVEATGALFLEAPFTGSKPAAEQRKTVYYVGGSAECIEKARPVLERLGATILHIGPLGTASSLKLAMNLNIAGVAQALCESLALSRAEGISDEVFFSALRLNASHSGVADLKEPKLRAHDYAPQFSLKHMAKDLRLAQETAAGMAGLLGEMTKLTEFYQRGLAAGWADEDYICLMRLIAAGGPKD